jgi:hypothetical protein
VQWRRGAAVCCNRLLGGDSRLCVDRLSLREIVKKSESLAPDQWRRPFGKVADALVSGLASPKRAPPFRHPRLIGSLVEAARRMSRWESDPRWRKVTIRVVQGQTVFEKRAMLGEELHAREWSPFVRDSAERERISAHVIFAMRDCMEVSRSRTKMNERDPKVRLEVDDVSGCSAACAALIGEQDSLAGEPTLSARNREKEPRRENAAKAKGLPIPNSVVRAPARAPPRAALQIKYGFELSLEVHAVRPSQYGTTGSSSPSRGLRFELRHQKRRATW